MKTVRIALISLAVLTAVSCITSQVAIEKNDTPLTLSQKAQDYFSNKEYTAAISYYQAIIDNYKKDQFEKEIAWAYYEIGFCYFTMGNNDLANKYFNTVINDFSIQAPRVLAEKIKLKIAAKIHADKK